MKKLVMTSLEEDFKEMAVEIPTELAEDVKVIAEEIKPDANPAILIP